MRTAASNWATGADRLTSASRETETLSKTKLEMGIFRIVWDDYNSAADYIQARLHEGGIEFENVSRALRTSADAYESMDGQFAGSLDRSQAGEGL